MNVTTVSSKTSTTSTAITSTTTHITKPAGLISTTRPTLKPNTPSTSVSSLLSTHTKTSNVSAVPPIILNVKHTSTQTTGHYAKTTVPLRSMISSATEANFSYRQNCSKARLDNDKKSESDACQRRNTLMTVFIVLGALLDCVLLVLVAYFGYGLYRVGRVVHSDTNIKTAFRQQNSISANNLY